VVVATKRALRPWRFSPYYRQAAGVIELPAGTLAATQTAAGDRLRLPSLPGQRATPGDVTIRRPGRSGCSGCSGRS
jgi:hypothetical protein